MCNKPLESGFICTNCRRLLCKDCSTNKKCDCGSNTIELCVNQAQIKNVDAQRVVISGNKRFGLAGFNSFPVLAYEMLDLLSLISKDYVIILVNSRSISKKLAQVIGNNQIKGPQAILILNSYI